MYEYKIKTAKEKGEKNNMEVNIQTRQAYSEIDEFLSLLDEKKRNEVPFKLREFFKKEKDNKYHKIINPNISVREQNLKSQTLALIALLNLQYWCKNEQEKERLKRVYANNENKYQEELRKKYNSDNIFKKKINQNKTEEKIEESNYLTEYKENIFIKLLNKIKLIIRK